MTTSREAEAEEVLRTIAKRNGVELADIIIVPEEARLYIICCNATLRKVALSPLTSLCYT